MLSTLAYLLGMQANAEYKVMLPVALDNDVTPIEAKEVLYQAIDYLGLGRVFPFFKITNEILTAREVKLPLKSQSTTTMKNRLEKGEETQIRLFGKQMKDFAKKGTINKWLVNNCFGDYYTRTGLDDRDREMITFCYIAAQGGCEPQLMAHAQANIKLGNDKEFLTKVVEQNVPFIGYPRSLGCTSQRADGVADVAQLGVDRHHDVGEGVGLFGAFLQLVVQLTEAGKGLLLVGEHLDHLLALHHLLDVAVHLAQIPLLLDEVLGGAFCDRDLCRLHLLILFLFLFFLSKQHLLHSFLLCCSAPVPGDPVRFPYQYVKLF